MAETLAQRHADQLDRHLTTQPATGGRFEHGGQVWLNFASNDYLDLARHPALAAAAAQAAQDYGTGSTASRLIAGTLSLHTELEQALAEQKGYPAALVFGSGYMTNLGIISALAGRNDVVCIDRLAHASIIDAARLSGARLLRFRHNDPADLDRLLTNTPGQRRLVVTESVFSMDGDCAPIADLATVCARHDALFMVDEAHAGGVFGAGLVVRDGLQEQVHLCMGTFSKALGGYGGYVCCSALIRDYLINHARAFIYTTAPPPGVAAAARAALELVHRTPTRGETLLAQADRLRQRLRADGYDTLNSASQIIPVLVGDNGAVTRIADHLRRQRILVGALRPPTVPPGQARLRLSLTSAHSEADLDHLCAALNTAFQHVNPA
jgi:8-amino-7-oxononanoate synthase